MEPNGHKLNPTAGKTRTYSDGATHLDRQLGILPFQSPGGAQMRRVIVLNYTMQDLANAVSSWFDRPVLDRTGLNGRFDFTMEYEPDPEQPRFPPTLGGPEVVEAMRKQLGLRLEAKKAPVDVLVIDRVERPTDN